MEDDGLCKKCGVRPSQGGKAMYPNLCRLCSEGVENLLDKYGILNKLKRKKGK